MGKVQGAVSREGGIWLSTRGHQQRNGPQTRGGLLTTTSSHTSTTLLSVIHCLRNFFEGQPPLRPLGHPKQEPGLCLQVNQDMMSYVLLPGKDANVGQGRMPPFRLVYFSMAAPQRRNTLQEKIDDNSRSFFAQEPHRGLLTLTLSLTRGSLELSSVTFRLFPIHYSLTAQAFRGR